MMDFEAFIGTSCERMVEFACDENMIIKPSFFKRLFEIRKTRSQVWKGGLRKVSKPNGYRRQITYRPIIRYNLHPRYTDKQGWMVELLATKILKPKASWIKAIAHAEKLEWYHIEYSRFYTDSEIGGFISDDAELHLLAVIAHEVAHSIAQWNSRQDKVRIKPHGSEWRVLYRQLRNQFVNHKINHREQVA